MICYLIHGFNVKDRGAETTDRLKPHLAGYGYTPVDLDYGWTGMIKVRLCNRSIARAMAAAIIPGSAVIGHSNGAALIYQAARAGARFSHVTLINPALDSDLTIKGADSVNVWFSPSDRIVWAARWLRRHTWGDQGRVGCTERDARYHNINADIAFADQVGHSGIFDKERRLQAIVRRMNERLK